MIQALDLIYVIAHEFSPKNNLIKKLSTRSWISECFFLTKVREEIEKCTGCILSLILSSKYLARQWPYTQVFSSYYVKMLKVTFFLTWMMAATLLGDHFRGLYFILHYKVMILTAYRKDFSSSGTLDSLEIVEWPDTVTCSAGYVFLYSKIKELVAG